MIKWDNYFDHIYCIFFLGQNERKKYIDDQLDRIGMLNSGIFSYYYTTNNPLLRLIQKNINIDTKYSWIRTNYGALNATFGHYCILLEAQQIGYKKILILESDASFINDIGVIQKHMENIPNDYDLILFDRNPKFENIDLNGNELYVKYTNKQAQYTLFTLEAMSDKMINAIINVQNRNYGMTDDIWNNDEPEFKDLNFYISKRHLAIQKEFANRSSVNADFKKIYLDNGVNLNEYYNYL